MLQVLGLFENYLEFLEHLINRAAVNVTVSDLFNIFFIIQFSCPKAFLPLCETFLFGNITLNMSILLNQAP